MHWPIQSQKFQGNEKRKGFRMTKISRKMAENTEKLHKFYPTEMLGK